MSLTRLRAVRILTVNRAFACNVPFSVRLLSYDTVENADRVTRSLSFFADTEFGMKVQDAIVSVNEFTGLPWWANIVGISVVLRTFVTLPLIVYQQKQLNKLSDLDIVLKDFAEKTVKELRSKQYEFNLSARAAKKALTRQVRRRKEALYLQHNVHPAKAWILQIVQFPLWVTVSASITNLCYKESVSNLTSESVAKALSTGGVLWFKDLTSSDPLFILPFLLAVNILISSEYFALRSAENGLKYPNFISYLCRGCSVVMFIAAANAPSALTLYWCSSALIATVQNISLSYPSVQRFFGVKQRSNPLKPLSWKYVKSKLLKIS